MMRRMLTRLRSDERGAAVIELAIIAPIFALMTIGVVDMSNAMGRKLALEQGAQRAIERVMQTTGTTTVEATIKNEAVCQVNGVNSDGTCKTSPITLANVTVTYRLECTDSGGTVTTQTSTDSDAFDDFYCATGTVTEAKYLQVALTDKYKPLFPIHFGTFNGDGTYHLSATAGMRTK
jgi:Flp pilus assembly protein TadG